MRSEIVKGTIFAVDKMQIEYAVCNITQVNYIDDSYEYIFEPNYTVIDMLSSDVFQGIPGLDLDYRMKKYVRHNRVPTFIYERTPQSNREDLYEYLDESKLEFLDPLEWLIRTDYKYTGDNLVVKRYQEAVNSWQVKMIPGSTIKLDSVLPLGKTNYKRLKTMLQLVAIGCNLHIPEFNIDDSNRKNIYGMIKTLYEAEYKNRGKRQQKGIENAKDEGKYMGRKKIDVSLPKLAEVSDLLEDGVISTVEAMDRLGLKSKSTLYRRLNEYRNNIAH